MKQAHITKQCNSFLGSSKENCPTLCPNSSILIKTCHARDWGSFRFRKIGDSANAF